MCSSATIIYGGSFSNKKYFVSDAAATRGYFSVNWWRIVCFNLKKIKKTDLPNFSAYCYQKRLLSE